MRLTAQAVTGYAALRFGVLRAVRMWGARQWADARWAHGCEHMVRGEWADAESAYMGAGQLYKALGEYGVEVAEVV